MRSRYLLGAGKIRTKKYFKSRKRGLTKAMVQSIDISIVLRGRCIARKDDSINKASEM
ncbi:hypothetical protein HMPREF1545_03089 [Oscillibacter sp. KLE 1728]|nr:hypothetical protein HMPREF1545_03089 [Oscillibacter sp. KLE 1728]ERK58676.1 hypothetical protein HMPREF1546_03645 [Oscillibacter sp. KLE 1745]